MTKMKNTVYYLGAGASTQAIPAINGLRGRIKKLASTLDHYISPDNSNIVLKPVDPTIAEHVKTLRTIKDDLMFLHRESKTHQTVDTLARKYYLREDTKNLKKLKRGLVSYFFFEQCIGFGVGKNNHEFLLDKRYDNLIASIADRINGEIKLRDDIKIITWNYDLQIEHAIQNYTNKLINIIKDNYQIHPNQNSFNQKDKVLIDPYKFAMFKLNGNAFLDRHYERGDLNKSTPHDINVDDKLQLHRTQFIAKYLVEFDELFPEGELNGADVFKYFNFAWEKDEKYPGFDNMITNILDVIKNTERLIIVGYSFPFFNAEIDRKILSACRPREIIIQDLYPETIKDRLLELIPDYGAVPDKIKPPIKFTLQLPGNYFPISAAV